ncbi:TlpA family protein disulfide reductase [Actinoallomurus sp. CA-150999]|uniref:TlpA family protein disulfide reductase n=1 Tax=Actinoallomurus sp. CA-150999 TaxID=3239887 RepID=UPI003D922D70
MPVLVVAVVFVGILCGIDLLLTLAVIRRLREHTLRLADMPPTRPDLVRPGTPLGDFKVTAEDGSTVSREAFTSPTVVGVFSTDCSSCHERLPEFTAFVETARPQQVLALVTGQASDAAEFTAAMGAAVTVVVEPLGGPFGRALQVSQFPSFYLIGDDAVIVAAESTPGQLPVTARA